MLKNSTNIPVSLAVWLAYDQYDYNNDPNYISVTSLLNPVKEIILSRALTIEDEADIDNMIASSMGTAMHNDIEHSWKHGAKDALKNLGYPAKIYNSIRINPGTVRKGDIPVYMEIRTIKQIGKWKVGGKFDFVIEGKLTDFKSTSVWTWIFGSNDKKYIQQGSMYRWLNPELITQDDMEIGYIFTDWSKSSAAREKNYPSSKIMGKKLSLMSLQETQTFMENKLHIIEQNEHLDQASLPICTSNELWEKPAVFKYYKNPAKKNRSTKNFDSLADAQSRKAFDGNVGEVVEVKGEKVYCKYCSALGACQQAEGYILEGSLIL